MDILLHLITSDVVNFDQGHQLTRQDSVFIQAGTKKMYIDSSNFDQNAAGVFCRDMGPKFVDGHELSVIKTTSSVMNLKCTGSERNILECKASWDPREATTVEVAGVECHYKGIIYNTVQVICLSEVIVHVVVLLLSTSQSPMLLWVLFGMWQYASSVL